MGNPSTGENHGWRLRIEAAAEIMGPNFRGPEVVGEILGKEAKSWHRKSVPFSAELLKVCSNDFVLQAIAPASVMELWNVRRSHFMTQENPWFGKPTEHFSRDNPNPSWELVRKSELPFSNDLMDWGDQKDLLRSDQYIPGVSVMVQVAIAHFMTTGERLFSDIWIRTASRSADHHHVRILYGASGLLINEWEGSSGHDTGLAVAWKHG